MNGTNGVSGTNGMSALVRLTAEAPNMTCPAGGTRIEAGTDANRNGTLEPTEATTTQFVCSGAAGTNGTNGSNGMPGTNGTNGRNALVATAAEPAGTNCVAGGTRVQAGLDANGNNTLDSTEVTSTGFVCNGLAGDAGIAGAAGRNSLIANVLEAPGANCPTGGRRITTGVDTNGNGTLDTTEVTATSFVCNGPGLLWVDATTASIQTAVNTGYVANNAGGVTFTLPTTAVVGDIVRFKNGSSPAFTVAQNAGQSINISGLDAFSSIAGSTWTSIVNTGVNQYETRIASSADGNTVLLMNSYSTTIRVSTDSGRTFVTSTPFTDPNLGLAFISPSGSTMYIASFDGPQGVYVSTNTGLNWTQRTSLQSVRSVAVYQGGAVAIGTPPAGTVGLYRTTDNAQTWTNIPIAGLPMGACLGSVAASEDGTVLAVGGDGSGTCPGTPVFVSGNSGTAWNASPNGAGPFQNRSQFVSVSRNGRFVAVVSNNGDVPFFSSSDLGLTWATTGTSFRPLAVSPTVISGDGQRLFVAGALGVGGPQNIHRSDDRGVTWTTSTLPAGRTVSSLAGSVDGNTVFYGEGRFQTGGSSVFRSASVRSTTATTTTGTTGSVTAGPNAALELQFLGSGRWGALSGLGSEFVVR